MRKKAVWTIPSILAMALLALLVVLPASAAPSGAVAGTLDFLSDDNTSIQWGNAGATIRLEVQDKDLDVPVKRVLLDSDVTGLTGTVTTNGSTTLDGSGTNFDADIAVGDTILVSGETVREVDEINSGTQLTVTTAFSTSVSGRTIDKVHTANGSFDNCPRCAAAYRTTAGTTTDIDELLDVVDTNVGAGLGNRFTGAPDTAINKNDVLVTRIDGSDFNPSYTVDLSNGQIDITGSGNVAVLYWAGSVNTAEVKVTSQADAEGINVTLTETGSVSGIFRGDIKLVTTESAPELGTPELKVAGTGSDLVTLRYSDASPSSTISKSLNIENTPPSFSNTAPAHGTATTQSLPTVSGTVTDTASGVKKDTIRVKFNVGEVHSTLTPASPTGAIIESATGVFDVSQRNPTTVTDDDVLWWLIADDGAGNEGVSDQKAPTSLTGTVSITEGTDTVTGIGTKFLGSDAEIAVNDTITVAGETREVTGIASETSLTVGGAFTQTLAGQLATKSTCSPGIFNDINTPTTTNNGGCEPFVVRVDNTAPSVNTATTGIWWNATKTTGDKSETDPALARKNSIRLEFSESLDASTIQTSDFRVAGAPPSAAESFSGKADSVFLTVTEQASNAKPKVELVGEVKDQAGNAVSTGTVSAAADGIAPSLTTTVTGTTSATPATKDKVTILLVADEDTNTPTVTVYKVGGTTGMGGNTLQTGTVLTPIPTGTARNWSVDYAPAAAGLYSVYVTVQDIGSSNPGKAGLEAADANDTDTGTDGIQIDLTKAILFEKDTSIPAPSFIPADGGSTDNPDTFVTVDFTDEGKEYGLTASVAPTAPATAEAGKQQTTTPADVVTDYDGHSMITLVSATVDDVDVTSLVNTRDDIKFAVRPGSLTAGSHTVKVTVRDEAGNEGTFSSTFEVTARGAYKIPIDPGFNLISIPATPTHAGINDVIGATSPINFVMTFDNASGLFLVSSRDTDPESNSFGQLVGNLTSIDGQHAYWVQSDQFVDLEVTLPRLDGGRPLFPPTIQVFEGWNLVPIVDPNQRATGTAIPVEDYFSNLGGTWTAYEFNTQSAAFTKITADTVDGQVVIGRGYFVYVSTDGVIIP